MATSATSDQLQEAPAPAHESQLHIPGRHFDISEVIETLDHECTLPEKQRRRRGGNGLCSDHPFARRVRPHVLSEYRYADLEQLDADDRDFELFKIALADVDPIVCLPEISVLGPQGSGVQTCRWSQTRAYHGIEGRWQPLERWEFVMYGAEDWYNIQQRLINHEAMGKMSFETPFGICMMDLREEHDMLSSFADDPSCFEARQAWKRDFDACLYNFLRDLRGSLPSCSLYDGNSAPSLPSRSLYGESTTLSTASSETSTDIAFPPTSVLVALAQGQGHNDSYRHDSPYEVAAAEVQDSILYWQESEAAISFDPADDLAFCPLPDDDQQFR